MIDVLLYLLKIAYASSGIVATIGYFPTIRDLWKHKKMSANIPSYVIWVATTAITFMYSLFVLPDFLFRLVSFLSFASYTTILVLAVILRAKK